MTHDIQLLYKLYNLHLQWTHQRLLKIAEDAELDETEWQAAKYIWDLETHAVCVDLCSVVAPGIHFDPLCHVCHAALLAITAVTVITSFSFKAHSFCQQKRIRTIPKGRNYGNVQFSSCFAIFLPSRHWHERGQLCFHVLFFVVLSTCHHFNRLVLALDLDQERVPELPSSISKQFMVCFSNVSFSPNSQDKVQRFTEENSVILPGMQLLCFSALWRFSVVQGHWAAVFWVFRWCFWSTCGSPVSFRVLLRSLRPSTRSFTVTPKQDRGLCWDLNTEMLADFQYFGMSWEFE